MRRSAAKKRILLADGSPTIRLLEERLLGGRDYEYESAKDGEEALESIARHRPDLILFDPLLPRIDGFELLHRLQSAGIARPVPVVMISAGSELSAVEEGFRSGCSDYVTKPIDGVELVAKVRNLIGDLR